MSHILVVRENSGIFCFKLRNSQGKILGQIFWANRVHFVMLFCNVNCQPWIFSKDSPEPHAGHIVRTHALVLCKMINNNIELRMCGFSENFFFNGHSQNNKICFYCRGYMNLVFWRVISSSSKLRWFNVFQLATRLHMLYYYSLDT